MCQGEVEKLSNSSEHCQVQKVASLLAQALSALFRFEAEISRQLMWRQHVIVREKRISRLLFATLSFHYMMLELLEAAQQQCAKCD